MASEISGKGPAGNGHLGSSSEAGPLPRILPLTTGIREPGLKIFPYAIVDNCPFCTYCSFYLKYNRIGGKNEFDRLFKAEENGKE